MSSNQRPWASAWGRTTELEHGAWVGRRKKTNMETGSRRDWSELEIGFEDGVVSLTLNRPNRRNALSESLLMRLEEAIRGIRANREARVVVLGARGSAFCSGHDLSEMVGRSESEYRDLFASCTRVMAGLRRLPQPVIARVQGPATAAGCQLVASCDLVVASTEASFATPGVKIGLFCTTPMVSLSRVIPEKAANEMLLIGAPITAERARELGLVNRVTAPDALDTTIAELADAIRSTSPLTIRTGKAAMNELRDLDESSAYQRAIKIMTDNAMREDAQEGIQAFLDKREPSWKDD